MTVHNATLEIGGEVFHFSSLDGKDWLPVSRPGLGGEEKHLSGLLEGDGNFKPLRFTRGYLEGQGALFTMADSQTENQEGDR